MVAPIGSSFRRGMPSKQRAKMVFDELDSDNSGFISKVRIYRYRDRVDT